MRSSSEFSVVMGTMDRFIRTATTLSYTITAFKYHEQFNTEDMRNDIALMFLNGQVPPNFPTVQPISPATYAVQPGSICQINGWGTDAFVSFRKFAILFKSEILAQGDYRQLQPMHFSMEDLDSLGSTFGRLFCLNSFPRVLIFCDIEI